MRMYVCVYMYTLYILLTFAHIPTAIVINPSNCMCTNDIVCVFVHYVTYTVLLCIWGVENILEVGS